MTDVTRHEVTDELGVVAVMGERAAAEGPELWVVTPRVVLTRGEAAQVVAAAQAAFGDAPVATIVSLDPLVRDAARVAGFVGGLRAPLVRRVGAPPTPVPSTVADYLPDALVDLQPASSPRRVVRFLATGLDRAGRITARRDGVEASLVVPLGPDTLVEPVAATVDTVLTLTARLGPVATRIPPVRFSINDAGIAGGRTAGANAGAAIVLSPMYVDASAVARIRKRRDAEARGAGSPRHPRWEHFPVDLVIVHEIGHSLDQATHSGRLSDTVGARRTLGESVGVPSIELALRAGWQDAPAAWVAAHEQVVTDLSLYATTNCVELFAEAFVAWYLHEETALARAMDAVLRERYPDLP
jgi:hypothetical protein